MNALKIPRRKILMLIAQATLFSLFAAPSCHGWIQYLDGSTLPSAPWIGYQDGPTDGRGDTVVVDFVDPVGGTNIMPTKMDLPRSGGMGN